MIGIFSGTFDPVHDGHMAFAHEAKTICKLDKIVFLPESQPRYKTNVTDVSKRYARLHEEATAIDFFEVAQLNLSQFTIRSTLPLLRKAYGDSLCFLIGSDVVDHISSWDNISQLLHSHALIVGMRTGNNESRTFQTLSELYETHNLVSNFTIVTTNYPHIASSQLR